MNEFTNPKGVRERKIGYIITNFYPCILKRVYSHCIVKNGSYISSLFLGLFSTAEPFVSKFIIFTWISLEKPIDDRSRLFISFGKSI